MDLSVEIIKRIDGLVKEEKKKEDLAQNQKLKKFIGKVELVLLEEAYNYVAKAEAKMRIGTEKH